MKKSLIIIALFLGFIIQNKSSFASHYAGAELTYTCIGGSNYQITLTFYKDCSGIAPPSNAQIYFVCGSNSNLSFNINLNQLPNTGAEITPACSQTPSACSYNGGNSPNNGHPYGVKEIVYQGNVTLPPCADWNMYWSGGARNPITTLMTSGNWYIPAQLNNSVAFGNDGPVYNNKMITIANINQLVLLDYGATDPDGDSLAYSLYAPYTSGPTPLTSVIYLPAYNETNFLSSSTPITINPYTGMISCTPDLSLTTAYGVRIDQWRDISGTMTMIGSNYRDLTLKVTATGNSTPTLSGMDFTNSHIYNPNDTIFSKSFYSNNLIEFDINGFDADTANSGNTGNPEKFNIAWNNGVPAASFTIDSNGTSSAYAHFSWTPTISDTGDYSFTVTIQDLACSYYAESSIKYTISVNYANTVSLNTNNATVCNDSSITLIATTFIDNPTYVWKRNGIIINTPNNTNTLIYSSIDLTPQIDTVTICIQGPNSQNCLATDTALIDIVYHPNINISDTGFCAGSSLFLDAGEGEQYMWKNEAGNTVGIYRILEINQVGTYSVYVNGRTNSTCFDIDTFTVGVSVTPEVNLGEDVFMEYSDSITLDAGSINYEYLWSTAETTPTIVLYGNNVISDSNNIWVDVINENCVVRDSILVTMLMSIETTNIDANFSIYPNPNNGEFNLNIKSSKSYDLNISIYNSMGKNVLQKNINSSGNSNNHININELAKGAYFIIIKSSDSVVWTSKILVQ